MRLHEILNESGPPKVDIEHMGNWIVAISKEPIVLKSVTGDRPQYVAKITNSRKTGVVFIGAGPTQAAARDAAMKDASKMDRPDTVKNYSRIECVMNIDFIREHIDDLNNTYFKFVRDDVGQTELVMASKHFAKVYVKELTQQGFYKSYPHANRTMCRFLINQQVMTEYGLVPNMRYILRESDMDDYGNQMFELVPTFRSQGPWDSLLLNTPGMTVAAIAEI